MNTLLSLALVCALVVFGVDARPPWGRGGRGGRGQGGQGGQGGENPSDPVAPGGQGGPGGFGRPGRGRFGPRRDLASADAQRSRWNRTVDGTDVRQGGFSSDSDQKIIVGTFGRNLDTVGLTRGGTLYDLSGATPYALIRQRRRCYIITFPAGETFTSLSTDLISRNGTTVTAALPPTEQLTAIGGQLSDTDRQALVDSNPTVGFFCAFADIYQTSAADAATFPAPGAEPEGQTVSTFLTLTSRVSILADSPPPRPPFFPGGGRPRPGGFRG